MRLPEAKQAKLQETLHKWIKHAGDRSTRIPFGVFEKTIAKLRHAFTLIPAGNGLLSPCNGILGKKPPVVYLHRNKPLRAAIRDARHLLHIATRDSTPCKELVTG